MTSIHLILNNENIEPNFHTFNEEEQRSKFLEKLEEYLNRIGKPLEKIPQMGYQNLDLYLLFNYVQDHGGYGKVTKKMGTWSKIWRMLPNYDGSITDASSRLKRHYERFLLDFEYETHPERRAQNTTTQFRFTLVPTTNNTNHAEKTPKRHKSSPKSPTNKEIPRDIRGKVIYPIVLGEITIHFLGSFIPSISRQWPIGFTSSRLFSSMIHPNQRVRYESSIINIGNKPKFMVRAEDDQHNPIIAESPSAAWKQVLEKVSAPKSVCVSGSLRYGLLHPTVKILLEELKEKCFNKKKKSNNIDPLIKEEEQEQNSKKKAKLPTEVFQSITYSVIAS